MINFGLKDALDIVLVALMLYYIYKLMKRSSAANIFSGIIIFIIVWLIFSQILQFKLLGTMLNYVVNIGALALVVLFQDDIRRFLSTIGTTGKYRIWMRFLRGRKDDAARNHDDIMPIVLACQNMSKKKVGALIIIENKIGLSEYIDSGEIINANINQQLIENIFFKNSPLHDGAMIIREKRIIAAGCILPVSHDTDIPKSFGLRHRAALGISQKTDALAIVVSEETGSITAAVGGEFHSGLTAGQLESLLSSGDVRVLDEDRTQKEQA